MTRFVQPSKDQLHILRRPLTPGERMVFDFFDKYLDREWEIYIEPHLNGLRPDFVLLHPKAGIAVFEVKDWNLDAMGYCMQRLPDGRAILMGKKDGKAFSLQDQNPIEKAFLYKQEIHELYCPRLQKQFGFAVITAGVIFPFADDARVKDLFSSSYRSRVSSGNERYHPLVGKQALQSGDILNVFPEGKRQSSQYMSPDLADDLRNWLVEPDFAATQRVPLELDANQRVYVTTRTETGYRRIKGPAGSGKSLILAARAAQLSSEEKDVLVVTFNITLPHYLRDLAVRWSVRGAKTRQNITWLNFHQWCKRTAQQSGREDDYRALWAQYFETEQELQEAFLEVDNGRNTFLSVDVPQFVSSLIKEHFGQRIPRYDAILVDEGQDILPGWWSALRQVCKSGGEMLLVADSTQDVYGNASAWTEQAMTGAGFRGDWVRLSTSYRMPPLLIQYARTFAQQLLPKELVELPEAEQMELNIFPCHLRWVQTEKEKAVEACLKEVLALPIQATPDILSIPDITFLSDSKWFGRQVVDQISPKGIKTIHTFSVDERESRRQKLAFFMGDARVKATTIHSFKGWEARALLLYIGHARSNKALAAIYAGITRLKRHIEGSYLTVVCSAPELEGFGRTWPAFERVVSNA
jgi:Nuclease-related domain